MASLRGRVVAITGGARGIGLATASAALRRGAKVAVGDIDGDLASDIAGRLGPGCTGLHLDVTDAASFTRFLDETERRLGALDVLVNNAGVMPLGRFVDEAEATTDQVVDVNLRGTLIGSRLALRRMLTRNSGHLVNVASTAGKAGAAGAATYCATKHAVIGFSEAIRMELRDSGITVSCVMPGIVRTELADGLAESPLAKSVGPDAVADAIIDAVERARFEVYVPQSAGVVLLAAAAVPRRAREYLLRLVKADDILSHPDRTARAAYEARVNRQAHGALPHDDSSPLA